MRSDVMISTSTDPGPTEGSWSTSPMSSTHLIDRRTYLKGMGVALALPLMESMGWAEPAKKAAKPPIRLGFMYMPHGVIMDQFWPASPESFLTAPPPALESRGNVQRRAAAAARFRSRLAQ